MAHQPPRKRTGFKLLLKKIRCYVAKHDAPHYIGALHRKGFGQAQVYQCGYCNEIFMQSHTVTRLGGKEAK